MTYKIAIERKGAGNRIALTVDGAPIKGSIVHPPADGRKEVRSGDLGRGSLELALPRISPPT